jgi:predicted DsbA family dithiol-disulfide isomerase
MEVTSEAVATTTATPTITIISDFVCPWCYIGLMEVERLAHEYEFLVRLEPYLLRPETPPQGIAARHITPKGAPLTATEQRAEALGIRFTRGRTWSSYSHYALEASAFAQEHGDAWRVHRALFKAYFEDLADIGDVDTVARIGGGAGVDADELRRALNEGTYRQLVDEGIQTSRDIGVTAIPTFIFNDEFAMVGAHELPSFRYAMEKLGVERKAGAPPVLVNAADVIIPMEEPAP